MLTPWKKDRILVDPFCGSGTFPIEAAMMAANIAPGMNRHFLAEKWENLIPDLYISQDAKEEADDLVDLSVETDIQGYDIDGEIIKAARDNAKDGRCGSSDPFPTAPGVRAFAIRKSTALSSQIRPTASVWRRKRTFRLCIRRWASAFRRLDSWSEYVITAYEDAEKYIGRKADKNRKIYNGMMKTYFYQFLGPRPPKRKQEENA